MAQATARPIRVYRGTLEEVLCHRDEIPPDAFLELKVFDHPNDLHQRDVIQGGRKPSAGGKYAFVPGGSEEFAREKQREIEIEDRRRG